LVDTQLILLACYTLDIIALVLLAGYFIREFVAKRLRASLAWGLGFLFFIFVILNLAGLAVGEVSKSTVLFGVILSSLSLTLYYYGASLLFYGEGSFMREKMTVIIFIIIFGIASSIVYITPAAELAETLRAPFIAMAVLVTLTISVLFYQVSRRLDRADHRRRTVTLVSLAWLVVTIWLCYIGLFWGVYPLLEAGVFVLGSVGFLLLLYGMTTAKPAKAL
jgi:hypothetical protein